jgi:hypothetical protein
VDDARGLISGAVETERIERLTRELLDPAKELSQRQLQQIDDRNRALKDFARLGDLARRWQEELRELFQKSVSDQITGEGSPLRDALVKFDSLARWQRVQSLLLEANPEKHTLAKLAEKFDVQLLSMDGHAAKSSLAADRTAVDPAHRRCPKPVSPITDLATGLRAGIGGMEKEQRGAAIVFSDGQHNEGESPVEVAKVLGGKGTPVFPIGVGTHIRPRDLAIIRTNGPESVFY